MFVMGVSLKAAAEQVLPETGISGVYEVMVGTDDAEAQIAYFGEFGFTVVATEKLSAKQAKRIYGVDSALSSYRLQNGEIDSHGLLRILAWDKVLGEGVGIAPPETVGQRMAVMRTEDVYRLDDVYTDMRNKGGEPWLVTNPVYDDLYGMSEGKPSLHNRRVGVREEGMYGTMFNHVFFQRYGYRIPGYGTIGDHSPLRTSEFTHHDFNVKGDLNVVTAYYSEVLGMKSENEPTIDGEWQAGPRKVFQMEPGEGHWYRGFVSPNNICGKLKFFSAVDPDFVRDRSDRQRVGEKGITLHSFTTPKLDYVHGLASKADLQPSKIMKNEFQERSFLFTGPDGVSWQIIAASPTKNKPLKKLVAEPVNQ